jgi:di/tricarboxylate transporter
MVTTGVLSGFMNDIGVAALLLPVVMDIARRTERSPSRLLIPLAFGSLLGGLMTLIGTPPNLLISDALGESGLRPFEMFDYTPVGIFVMVAGVVFMALVGRHLLPKHDLTKALTSLDASKLGLVYGLEERMYLLNIPPDSQLSGKTLVESRFGAILGLNVIAIIRGGHLSLAPQPDQVIQKGDQLLVTGRMDRLNDFQKHPHLQIAREDFSVEQLITTDVTLAEIELSREFSHLGETLQQIDFRQRYGVIVLSIWREGKPTHAEFDDLPLKSGDSLLIQGERLQIDNLINVGGINISEAEKAKVSRLHKHLMSVYIPVDSSLVGKTLAESRLAEAFGLAALGILRAGEVSLLPSAGTTFKANDTILVRGDVESLTVLGELEHLEIEDQSAPALSELESSKVGLAEVVLSPHTTLTGKTLRQLHFREKYGLNVVAIWRGGKPHRSQLRDLALRFGDALLLHGPWEKLRLLASDPDFLVLVEEMQEAPRLKKAPLALLVMAGVLLPVILGWLPIYVAAVAGAALMVLTGCLSMEEAYRYIEWKAVFLIAGMLPLGIAMQQTGTARYLAEGVVAFVGGMGPLAILIALFVLTALASQVMPNPAVAVLLAPIALNAAADLGISPYPLMMGVAISASAAFLSPVAHPVNVLILGPGGYQFRDYLKVGVPLTLVILLVVLLVLPIFWPF